MLTLHISVGYWLLPLLIISVFVFHEKVIVLRFWWEVLVSGPPRCVFDDRSSWRPKHLIGNPFKEALCVCGGVCVWGGGGGGGCANSALWCTKQSVTLRCIKAVIYTGVKQHRAAPQHDNMSATDMNMMSRVSPSMHHSSLTQLLCLNSRSFMAFVVFEGESFRDLVNRISRC